MLRCLAFWQALYDFRLRAVHITGALNTGADQLSRNNAAAFLGHYSMRILLPFTGAPGADSASLSGTSGFFAGGSASQVYGSRLV